ncbi:MAG TPA: S41 family peptidase [Candidatus Hydrogenedentes bacterium]|nr:S41 family peptidase [Candidatus Hydrogenedentota bacterium]HRT19452.1 S41 family peptidase [Candidatus Hydrogenedentota bacterium]HRT63814.1 S41 family peptidase [Candidatus Hydrogenedentota bacterium]
MQHRQSKSEFIALLAFLIVATLVLTNGFVARISAQGKDVDVFAKIQPIGDVLGIILDEYVRPPDIDKVVEGALVGMLNALDRHSSFISEDAFKIMREETRGEFEGIGVSIRFDDDKNIIVYQPLADSPAAKAGILSGDIIYKVDGVSTAGMALEEVAKRIRGPRDSVVRITVARKRENAEPQIIDYTIKRGNIPIESIKEARLLPSGFAYVRVSDFKDTTAKDLSKRISGFLEKNMKGLILDLRWNPGGLLPASKDVCELFLPKNSLVTYTQGRKTGRSSLTENMKLYTEKDPLVPLGLPIVVLVNEETASCSEIVTGALQFYSRAIVVGVKTYGKGSVQTIIPLSRPPNTALRLTTALYYTPAEVTIDSEGIKPDVEVPFSKEEQRALVEQMFESVKTDASMLNQQNHGTITGNEASEKTAEDKQLQRAVEILQEDPVFDNLIKKYHKDTHETQVAAPADRILQQGPHADKDDAAVVVSPENPPAPEKK